MALAPVTLTARCLPASTASTGWGLFPYSSSYDVLVSASCCALALKFALKSF